MNEKEMDNMGFLNDDSELTEAAPIINEPVTEEVKEEKLSIKELTEALNMIDVFTSLGVKVFADRKLDQNDIPHALELFKNYAIIEAGIKDMDKAWAEIKDLDQAELLIVVARVFNTVKSVFSILKSK